MQFQLGINTRGGDGLMPQDIRYLFEARTSIHHLGGGCMSEDMAGDARRDDDVGLLKRSPNHPPDATCGTRPKRWATLQKDSAALRLRPSGLQVGHDGLTDVLRQR